MTSCDTETRAENSCTHCTFDVFLSTPLAALRSDPDLVAEHRRAEAVAFYLESDLGLRVYWAGRGITAKVDFQDAATSARENAAALLDSRWFLLLYFTPLASSALFEAGIALGGCTRSIYVVHRRLDLPFLLRHADTAFENVALHEVNPTGGAIALLRRQGLQLFDPQGSTRAEATESP